MPSQPLAERQDVEENYRPLTQHEAGLIESWLAGASAQLRVQVPGVDARIALDGDYALLVTKVVVTAVIRKLMGADPRDPTPATNIYYSKAELAVLNGESSGPLAPVGSFPAYCPLPTW